jgi:hypothetical protein
MPTASLAVLFALVSAAPPVIDDPEPPSRDLKNLLLELSLPHVGIPAPGKERRPAIDLTKTDLRRYRDRPAEVSALRKAVRTAQLALWACSDEEPPQRLRADVAALRRNARIDPAALKLRYPIPARAAEERFKADALFARRSLARCVGVLEDALEAVKAVDDQAERLGPRWQAHVLLLKVWLLRRTVSLEEHQAALTGLGSDLPGYDPQTHTAWRLVPYPRLRDVAAKKVAKLSEVLAEQLRKEHPGTAWDVLAKEAVEARIGADWLAVK